MSKMEQLAETWLAKAKDDISWAEDSLKTGHFAGVCFLTQQIAEKTLKAYLFFKGEKLVRTHNLIRLLARCKKFNPGFEKFLNTVKTLNVYYVDTRYPDIWDISRFEDEKLAKEALILTKELFNFVASQLTP